VAPDLAAALPVGRRGRLLALALACLALALIWLALVAPLMDLYATRAQRLAEQQVLADHMAALAAALPDLQRQGAGVPLPAQGGAGLLEGPSDAVAGAALQGRLQEMVNAAGASLTSAEMLPPRTVAGLSRIGVRASVYAADWPKLVGLLRAIREADPHLLIDDLSLHAMSARSRDTGPALDATFSVFGFRAPGPGAGAGTLAKPVR